MCLIYRCFKYNFFLITCKSDTFVFSPVNQTHIFDLQVIYKEIYFKQPVNQKHEFDLQVIYKREFL